MVQNVLQGQWMKAVLESEQLEHFPIQAVDVNPSTFSARSSWFLEVGAESIVRQDLKLSFLRPRSELANVQTT